MSGCLTQTLHSAMYSKDPIPCTMFRNFSFQHIPKLSDLCNALKLTNYSQKVDSELVLLAAFKDKHKNLF